MPDSKYEYISPTQCYVLPGYHSDYWESPFYSAIAVPYGKKLPVEEALLCEHGWENNCFHAKPVRYEAPPSVWKKAEEKIGYPILDGSKINTVNYGDSMVQVEVTGSRTNHVFMRESRISFRWGWSSETREEYWIDEDSLHVMRSYTELYNGVVQTHYVQDCGYWENFGNASRHGLLEVAITEFENISYWCYFREYTILQNPPKSNLPEPYVGRAFYGRPKEEEDTSFACDVDIQQLMQKAYYEAVSDIEPKMNDNNIANALEAMAAIGIVLNAAMHPIQGTKNAEEGVRKYLKELSQACGYKVGYSKTKQAYYLIEKADGTLDKAMDLYYYTEVVDGHFEKKAVRTSASSMAGVCANGWLLYRYLYSTTKMDVEEAAAWVDAQDPLDERDDLHYGHSSKRYLDSDIMCRCRVQGRVRSGLGCVKEAMLKLHTLGLEPNAYVMWDMLPFSFMLEWQPLGALRVYGKNRKLNISDFLNVSAAKQYLSTEYLEIDKVCFSLSYQRQLPSGLVVDYYTRWKNRPLDIDTEWWTEQDGHKVRTTINRVLDTVSIGVGLFL